MGASGMPCTKMESLNALPYNAAAQSIQLVLTFWGRPSSGRQRMVFSRSMTTLSRQAPQPPCEKSNLSNLSNFLGNVCLQP